MADQPIRPLALPAAVALADADVLIVDGAAGVRSITNAAHKAYLAAAFAGAPETFNPATPSVGGLVKVAVDPGVGVTATVPIQASGTAKRLAAFNSAGALISKNGMIDMLLMGA